MDAKAIKKLSTLLFVVNRVAYSCLPFYQKPEFRRFFLFQKKCFSQMQEFSKFCAKIITNYRLLIIDSSFHILQEKKTATENIKLKPSAFPFTRIIEIILLQKNTN